MSVHTDCEGRTDCAPRLAYCPSCRRQVATDHTYREMCQACGEWRIQLAPALTVGQSVTYQGRPSTITAVKGDIVTVSSYAGAVMIGADHPELSADLADWQRARLAVASLYGEVVKLTGSNSISTPWES